MRYYTTEVIELFTKLRLQNFRSFGNLEFDLTGKSGSVKPFVLIYGENGAGKSNLMSAFSLLQDLRRTMDMRDIYDQILSRVSALGNQGLEESMQEDLISSLKSSLKDIRAIIDDCRMVGNSDTVVVEYEFNINGVAGKYVIHLGEDEIEYEKLEYLLNKRRGTYFECSKEQVVINGNAVVNKDFLADIKETAKRFWGKHSMMAIIQHELGDKSKAYGDDSLSERFTELLTMFSRFSCSISIGNKNTAIHSSPFQILRDPVEGTISIHKENQLEMASEIFSKFFFATNSDIENVFYKKSYNADEIQYQLFFNKSIDNSVRSIPFEKESTGNHQLLEVFCNVVSACFGGIVVIDEADAGIHDYLFLKLIQEIYPIIKGQMIITTHNTLLMEAEFAREVIYILSEDEGRNKIIQCIADYDRRTYLKNNIRNKYLNNDYGGLPKVTPFEFEEIIDIARNT